MRSGNIIIGENLVVSALKEGKLCYVFLASDTGPNTTKKILDKSKFYEVEVNNEYDTLSLSQALGKENIKVIGIKKSGRGFLQILRK